MAGSISRLLRVACLMLLVIGLLAGGGATAQQMAPVDGRPANVVGPPVSERQLLEELDRIQGRVSIPDQKASVLEQPAGRDWRRFRTETLPWIGAIVLLGTLALLTIFYLWRGRIRIRQGYAGETITRFSMFERFVHWMTGTSFIVLALTGLNVSFGRTLLLPLIGPEAFTAVSQWGKYAHNFLSFPFVLGVLLMLVVWVAHNIPEKRDIVWLRQGGGFVGRHHPQAHRFNAGQKAIFWSVVLFGLAIAATGYVLMFPFYLTGIAGMQTAQIVHAIIGVVFMAVILGHIYIGTIGMQGAFEAMGSGEVDLNWAREHHALWVEEEERKLRAGKRNAIHEPAGAAVPAE